MRRCGRGHTFFFGCVKFCQRCWGSHGLLAAQSQPQLLPGDAALPATTAPRHNFVSVCFSLSLCPVPRASGTRLHSPRHCPITPRPQNAVAPCQPPPPPPPTESQGCCPRPFAAGSSAQGTRGMANGISSPFRKQRRMLRRSGGHPVAQCSHRYSSAPHPSHPPSPTPPATWGWGWLLGCALCAVGLGPRSPALWAGTLLDPHQPLPALVPSRQVRAQGWASRDCTRSPRTQRPAHCPCVA